MSAYLFAVIAPNANAASAHRSCFETETDVQEFVVNIKAYETSFHDVETKRRKIFGKTSQSYTSLRYILGDAPNLSFVDSESKDTPNQPALTQYTTHKHLVPGDVFVNDAVQYCSVISTEIHLFRDVWTVDFSKNLVLNSQTYTEIAR